MAENGGLVLNLSRKITIRAEGTAEQWHLYTATKRCDHVARELNAALEGAVNNGLSRASVRTMMHELMHEYRRYGAYDSEPLAVLEEALDFIFNPGS